MTYVICTPINTTGRPSALTAEGKKARIDYFREQEFFLGGTNPKWDDSHRNNARAGDKFAFVHQDRDYMEIFSIVAILPASARPTYWSMPEHQQRQVLILSQREGTTNFTDFKTLSGYKETFHLMGTARLTTP